ncbi:unnamed protein product [Paramecium sonneborni]|uniref:Uncharacterized protein n=1 Tax=Paramecium sonneborni TaxID=65129 RepID=A0A8S1JX13_9CILI|nr:unnamed protein product [Paramecium sonneborni]
MTNNTKLEDTFIESGKEDQGELSYIIQNICSKQTSIILLEPIISDETYLQKDIIAQLGSLIAEYTEFLLFEYNSRIPEDNICIIKNKNQNYQSTMREELMKSVKQKSFGIFLKFNCSINNERLNQKIKIGKNLINFLKKQLKNNLVESTGQWLNIFMNKLKDYQQYQIRT